MKIEIDVNVLKDLFFVLMVCWVSFWLFNCVEGVLAPPDTYVIKA